MPASLAPAPAVTVILPTHDRAALLARSAGSVLAQTFTDLELLVVDDASSQDIAATVAALGDARARTIRSDVRLGGAGARNLGLAQARGDLVAFQDSDDEWRPEKLARQLEDLRRAPPAVAVSYCAFLRRDAGTEKRFPRPGEERLAGDLSVALLRRNFVTTAATLVRRAVLEEAGGFDADMPRYQDWDLSVRIAQRHRFSFLDEPLLVQYHQPDSISQDSDARLRARLRLLDKHAALLRRHRSVLAAQRAEVALLLERAGRGAEARRLWWASLRARPSRIALGHVLGVSHSH